MPPFFPLFLPWWFACRLGTLQTPEGPVPLNTARYLDGERDGVPTRALLLSNGRFACDMPAEADPTAVQDALASFYTAACREGARHLVIRLASRQGDWEGAWSLAEADAVGEVLAGAERAADASWATVGEAFLVEIPELGAAPVSLEQALIEPLSPGTLRTEGAGDRWSGALYAEGIGLQATFHAEPCPGAGTLIERMTTAPLGSCY
jgi:hypothetical protein